MDFETTAMQIQRAFSGGASAADLFRERGVTAMLGFEAGARVSVEETIARFEELFSGDGRFAKATDDLAQTFEGTLSMIGDKVFNFQKTIAEAGFFPELKVQFGNLNNLLETNADQIDEFAKTIGTELAKAMRDMIDLFKLAKRNIEEFSLIIIALVSAFNPVAGVILIALTAVNQFRNALEESLGVPLRLADVFKGTFAFIKGQFDDFVNFFTTGFQAFINKIVEIRNHIPLLDDMALPFELVEEAINNADKSLAEYILEQRTLRVEAERIAKFYAQLESQLKQGGTLPLPPSTAVFVEKEFSKQIIALQDKFKSEEELIVQERDKQLKMLTEFVEKEKDLTFDQLMEIAELRKNIEEHTNRELQEIEDKRLEEVEKALAKERKIRKDHFKKQLELARSGKIHEVELEKLGQDQKEQIAKAGMRSALEGLAGHNRALFALNKAFKIKDAIIDGIAGVQKALALGPFGIPLAVLIGALTAANVSQIASTQYTGRRTGGQVTGGTPYMVGEQGPELFVPQQSGNIKPNGSLGGTTVNFNITTVDAKGFNELLTNSRGTIVGMINSAVNEQGRASLV